MAKMKYYTVLDGIDKFGKDLIVYKFKVNG